MREENAPQDLRPSNLRVYGYLVVSRRGDTWATETDDEFSNLPAHYPFVQQALDRAEHLRSHGIECRVAALLAEPSDTAEDFEAHRTP